MKFEIRFSLNKIPIFSSQGMENHGFLSNWKKEKREKTNSQNPKKKETEILHEKEFRYWKVF
jgi:hypothetical protein